MNDVLKRVLPSLVMAILPVFVEAACFESPTWRDEPVTESYIESIGNGTANRIEKAHLRVLRYSEDSVRRQRKELKRRLLPVILLHYDGDRGALRKKLLKSNMLEYMAHIDVSKLKGRELARVVSAYWLNGCTAEAIELLSTHGSFRTNQLYMPIATGDAQLLLELAEGKIVNPFHQHRLRTFASLLERPDLAGQTLVGFLHFLETNLPEAQFKTSYDIYGLMMAVAFSQMPSEHFDGENAPMNPALLALKPPFSIRKNEPPLEWAAVVSWVGAVGHCRLVEDLTIELLKLPAESLWPLRELVEATAIRCTALNE